MDLKVKIMECTDCDLYKVGNGPIPFYGSPSKVMIIGEAPGRQEDEVGRPLVGPAGKLLWEELAKVDIARHTVLRANAVCCYPTRAPLESERRACLGNLEDQVKFCKPSWILAIGTTANRSLGNNDPIGKIHGQVYEQLLIGTEYPIQVFPTYHPAAILRDRSYLRVWREDLLAFSHLVHRNRRVRAEETT